MHPLFKPYLDGGEMIEWGAKTIPEGGYYSVPSRRSGHGLVMLGDSIGLVDVPSLKGVHYAMQSGIYAAEATTRLRCSTSTIGCSTIRTSSRTCIVRGTSGWRTTKAFTAVRSRRG